MEAKFEIKFIFIHSGSPGFFICTRHLFSVDKTCQYHCNVWLCVYCPCNAAFKWKAIGSFIRHIEFAVCNDFNWQVLNNMVLIFAFTPTLHRWWFFVVANITGRKFKQLQIDQSIHHFWDVEAFLHVQNVLPAPARFFLCRIKLSKRNVVIFFID